MVTNLTLAQARQDIRDAFATNFAQPAFEGSVPSAAQLKRTNGAVYPYIVYRFPDVIPTTDTSMAGPQGDGYHQMVFMLGVAPDVETAEELYMKLLATFLGFQPSYSSMMTKRGGGGTFPVGVDSQAAEAFIAPCNFIFTTSVMAIP